MCRLWRSFLTVRHRIADKKDSDGKNLLELESDIAYWTKVQRELVSKHKAEVDEFEFSRNQPATEKNKSEEFKEDKDYWNGHHHALSAHDTAKEHAKPKAKGLFGRNLELEEDKDYWNERHHALSAHDKAKENASPKANPKANGLFGRNLELDEDKDYWNGRHRALSAHDKVKEKANPKAKGLFGRNLELEEDREANAADGIFDHSKQRKMRQRRDAKIRANF